MTGSNEWDVRVAAFSAFPASMISLIFEPLPGGDVANAKLFTFKPAVR
jgi:hypothetical protein